MRQTDGSPPTRDAIYNRAPGDHETPLTPPGLAPWESSSDTFKTWPGSGHTLTPGPPPHPSRLRTRTPLTLPPAPNCLPVCGTAAGRVGGGRQRVQSGDPRRVLGVAPALGNATHLHGQRRVLGGRPARGALPTLQGRGHGRRPGVWGVIDRATTVGKGWVRAVARGCKQRASAQQVRWQGRLRSRPGRLGRCGAGSGGGAGAEEEGGNVEGGDREERCGGRGGWRASLAGPARGPGTRGRWCHFAAARGPRALAPEAPSPPSQVGKRAQG